MSAHTPSEILYPIEEGNNQNEVWNSQFNQKIFTEMMNRKNAPNELLLGIPPKTECVFELNIIVLKIDGKYLRIIDNHKYLYLISIMVIVINILILIKKINFSK